MHTSEPFLADVMAIIYGVNTEQPVSPEDARDALVECFTGAHKSVLEQSMSGLAEEMSEKEVDAFEKLNVKQMIRNFFDEVGGDYEKPAKESIIAVCDKLAEFSKSFRDQQLITKHYGEIMQLVGKIE